MDSGGRARRPTKTPKRFDDEAFETPPKHHHNSQQQQSKASPEPVPTKSIIKVKLTKATSKPAQIKLPTTPKTATKEPSKPKDAPSKPPKDSISKTKDAPRPKDTSELKETPKVVTKEIPKASKEPTKPKEQTTPKQTTKEAVKPKEVPKVKEPPRPKEQTPKPKEIAKLTKEPPKIEIRTPERDITQLVYRPKTRRPRTPPVYSDVIPNVVLPFWDARTAAEDHEDDNVKELVHCHCGISEEFNLMVQCETCLTWQHAHCLGLERPEDVPDGYTCKACSDPKFARESMKYAYDQDWLTKGRMKKFSCDATPICEKKVEVLRKINSLIGSVLNINQIIHSLKIKSRILTNASDDDQELQLFRTPWPPNYQHRNGEQFVSTINHPSNTPASTISAIADTPDPGDINVETVVDAALPDIGQLEDVSAILDNSNVTSAPMQSISTNQEATPSDCRANLKLHIQQTEEFIGIELTQIEEQLSQLEKECAPSRGYNLETSLDSLKNDLLTMRKYIRLNK